VASDRSVVPTPVSSLTIRQLVVWIVVRNLRYVVEERVAPIQAIAYLARVVIRVATHQTWRVADRAVEQEIRAVTRILEVAAMRSKGCQSDNHPYAVQRR